MSRQRSRLAQETLNEDYDPMEAISGQKVSLKFKELTTHWLRHTGASFEIERGRH